MIELPKLSVWNYFQQLANIPRGSNNEQGVRNWLQDFASTHNFFIEIDNIGNVLIRKPTQHSTSKKWVLLQAHMDMVTVKDPSSSHNFETDAIKLNLEGDWLMAENTTLGADNGIGLCEILSILANTEITHPPLEALFTMNEETGMTGAAALELDWLHSKVLLNFDEELDEKITISSAGGRAATIKIATYKQPCFGTFFELRVDGLTGGHSGVEIHLPRLNAITVLAKILHSYSNISKLGLAQICGGQAGNAIPSSAYAIVCVPNNIIPHFTNFIEKNIEIITNELAEIEKNIRIHFEKKHPFVESVITGVDLTNLLGVITLIPQGPLSLSTQVLGLVESSNNLGIVRTNKENVECTFYTRSSLDIRTSIIVENILTLFKLTYNEHYNTSVKNKEAFRIQTDVLDIEIGAQFSGWSELKSSTLLQTFQTAYATVHKKPAEVSAIHAGLECGMVKRVMPANSEAISFGPTILEAHTPRERVSLTSVDGFDKVVKELLKILAT